jgi:hypothetical protein
MRACCHSIFEDLQNDKLYLSYDNADKFTAWAT